MVHLPVRDCLFRRQQVCGKLGTGFQKEALGIGISSLLPFLPGKELLQIPFGVLLWSIQSLDDPFRPLQTQMTQVSDPEKWGSFLQLTVDPPRTLLSRLPCLLVLMLLALYPAQMSELCYLLTSTELSELMIP